MSEKVQPASAQPTVKKSRRLSSAWIIPIVAIFLGGYLIARHFGGLGPAVQITFETAEGLEAGKTRVLCRSVEVGVVETVNLNDSLSGVETTIRLRDDAEKLLREDTRFWVVRPRIGGGGVSGLGTLLSGAYIELDPGTEGEAQKRYEGLEQPPATSQNTPGKRIELTASEAGSIDVGAPIIYRGLEVGQIERREFNDETQQIIYSAFVRSPFDQFVTTNVRFWNNSGVTLNAGANGVSIETASIETILRGGVTFSLPRNELPAGIAAADSRFRIYDSEDDMNDVQPSTDLAYLLRFDSSVRGLHVGAPVEFRGILVGKVQEVSYAYAKNFDDRRVPVVIRLDRKVVEQIVSADGYEAEEAIERAVGKGLVATLRTGSLLTGALFVSLEYPSDEKVTEAVAKGTNRLGDGGKFRTIPTMEGGFAMIEDRVNDILKMVEELPIQDTVVQAKQTLASIEGTSEGAKVAIATAQRTMNSLDRVISSDEFAELPADIQNLLRDTRTTVAGVGPDSPIYTDVARTLEDLQATMQSIKVLVDSIENRPNSLIFGREGDGRDPVPGRR